MSLFTQFKNQLDFDGLSFRVLLPEADLEEQLEKLPGVKSPSRLEPAWKIPALPLHVQRLSKLPLRWNEKAAQQGRFLIAEAASRLELSKATVSELDFTGFGLDLHGYQKAGVEYLLKAKRVLLADEMGLGKTAQALAFLFKEPAAYPALVITPASLKYWWKQEGERCLPGKRFAVLDSKFKPLDIQMADVVVTNYDLLAAGWETPEKKQVKLTALGEALLAHPFQAIILEEMHAVKSHAAQRTKAVRKLAEGKTYRIGITGTPVTNRPAELGPILQILGRLNDLGGWMYFMKRYCASAANKYNPFGGSRNEIELNERMRSSFYLRRTKADVKLELPPLTRSVVPVPIDNRKEYEFAEKQVIEWVKKKAEEDQKFRDAIAHLPLDTQLLLIDEYKHDKAQRAKRAEAMIKIGALKRISATGKLTAAAAWIDDFLDSDEANKLVIFATHANIIDALKTKYKDALLITSDMSSRARQDAVNSFQDNGARLLVGAFGTSAGSAPAATGLTLTAASNVLFLELGWTPAHHDQAEARIYRMGQEQPCNAYYLVGQNTIEKKILGLLDSKRAICDAITNGEMVDTTPPLVDLLLEELASA